MAYKGKFKPKNPDKYKGNAKDIIYRSLKERSIMQYLDECPNVVFWGSETVVVPYLFSVDKKVHRYFIDFMVVIKTKKGAIKKYLIEYKPFVQTQAPKKPKTASKKSKQRLLKETITYVKNQNKWDAAQKFAQSKGYQFVVISEKDVKGMVFFKSSIEDS